VCIGKLHEYLEIGEIVNTHGVKGEIKVIPLTDNANRFFDLKWVYIEKGKDLVKYNIEGVKRFKQFVILKLSGIDSMAAAEALKNLYLKVDRMNAVVLPDNSFFVCDLIDCKVFEKNGQKLGILKEVLQTGSNDVYVIEGENGREILIPALKSVVRDISLKDGSIIVDLPEGLVDDEV
jgi:16S rRNA processing protein RimM